MPDFAKQAAANAAGTLIAALILFLGGVIVGAIDDVPAETWLSAVALLISVLSLVAFASVRARRAEERRREEIAEALRDPDPVVRSEALIARLLDLGVLVDMPRDVVNT